MPLISIITISFNNLPELQQTCKSVDIQKQLPFEHVIIDGSTNTAIRDFLESGSQPSYRKWISEPDDGIADAFNKGLKLAKGDIVVMLNSADALYEDTTLKTVTEIFGNNPNLQWIHGKYQLVRGNQHVIIGKPYEKSKLYRGMRSICHQTMFYKKSLHDKYGPYNTSEKIGMDYDFLCRIADEPFLFTENVLINFAPAGISSVNYLLALKDAKGTYEKYYGKSYRLQLWQLRLKLLHYLLTSPIGNFLYSIKKALKLENM